MSAIPDHCPYRPGDRVQVHGYTGDLPGPGAYGFRGVVAPDGWMGATLLVLLGDDGGRCSELWGALEPDGTPCHDARCACCPHPGGICQPHLASEARARAQRERVRQWRLTGIWPPPLPEPQVIQYGQLALFRLT